LAVRELGLLKRSTTKRIALSGYLEVTK